MRIVKTLVHADVIPSWIPGGAKGTKHRYVFRTKDVEDWLSKLAAGANRGSGRAQPVALLWLTPR